MRRSESPAYAFLKEDDRPTSITAPSAETSVAAPQTDTAPDNYVMKREDATFQSPYEAALAESKPTKQVTPQTEAQQDTPKQERTSAFDNFASLVSQYTDKPLSQEERSRRERAATAAQGIGALGNAISAFSNLTYTGGVAPSQKLPELPDADKDIRNFRARIDKNRTAYLNNLLQGEALKRKADELEIKRAAQNYKAEADKAKAQNAKDLNDAKIGRMKAQDAKDAAQTAYWEAKVDALEDGLPLDLAEKRAKIAYTNAKASQTRSGGGGGNYIPVEVIDPVTGKLIKVSVTGNKAVDIYAGQEGEENRTESKTVDAFGGVSTRTTEKEQTAKQKHAAHTREAREAEQKKKKGNAMSNFSIHGKK